MQDLRSFIGTRCPACAKDILQPAPETTRMPIRDRLTCPRCDTQFRIEDLTAKRGFGKPGGLLARLFGTRPEIA